MIYLFNTISDEDWRRAIHSARERRAGAFSRMFGEFKVDSPSCNSNSQMILSNMSDQNVNVTQVLRDLVFGVLSQYLLHPEQIRVETFKPADDIVIYQITVAPEDRAKVIGDSGNAMRSLKTLFRCIGDAINIRVAVELKPWSKEETRYRNKPEHTEPDNSPTFAFGEVVGAMLRPLFSLLCGSQVNVDRRDSDGMSVYMVNLPTPITPLAAQALNALIERIGERYGRRILLHTR